MILQDESLLAKQLIKYINFDLCDTEDKFKQNIHAGGVIRFVKSLYYFRFPLYILVINKFFNIFCLKKRHRTCQQ